METSKTQMPVQNTGITKPKKEGGFIKWVTVVIIIALIIVGGLYLVSKYTRFNVLGLSSVSGNYQAVFLTNGQVYFGKISKESKSQVVLEQIYYLQVTQPLQKSGNAATGNAANSGKQNELSLVKLGNELHGPQDRMRINREHVLFIEDLKSDSRVVQAIENYKDTQSK